MRRIGATLLILVLAVGSTCAYGSEHRVEAQPLYGSTEPGDITLSCSNGVMQIQFDWYSEIGPVGRYRRHLFLPGALGNIHVLLPVLRGSKSTGLLHDDMQTKALVARMLEDLDYKFFSVEVYPQRPGDTSWVGRWFDYRQFKAAASVVAKECHWNLRTPPHSTLRMVNPGAPFQGG